MWNDKGLGKVSMTYAAGMLYCLSDRGKMSLVEADSKHCKVVSRFDVPRPGRHLSLAHPVVYGGRLYVRSWNELLVYDVGARSSE